MKKIEKNRVISIRILNKYGFKMKIYEDIFEN